MGQDGPEMPEIFWGSLHPPVCVTKSEGVLDRNPGLAASWLSDLGLSGLQLLYP